MPVALVILKSGSFQNHLSPKKLVVHDSKCVGFGILGNYYVTESTNRLSWLISGTPKECLAHEYSTVDAVQRRMEMISVNLTFW